MPEIYVENEHYTAVILPLDEADGWQEGAIDPGVQTDDVYKEQTQAVLRAIRKVDADQMKFGDCTDSRFRLNLLGTIRTVPLREKLVGSDIITGFAMAEALGPNFYGPELDTAPVTDRIDRLVAFLLERGFSITTHIGCGAAGGLVPVMKNAVRFSAESSFRSRQQRFVPGYTDSSYDAIIAGFDDRLNRGLFDTYSDAVITAAVTKVSGDEGVAVYLDDGKGVHGHTEQGIVRLQDLEGYALDVNALAEESGIQFFSVNDNRLQKLADTIGGKSAAARLTARLAGEAFSDAGHGTLGRNLRTVIVTPRQ